MLFVDGSTTENKELARAEAYIREAEFEKAMDILNGLAESEPENGRIWFDLGTVAFLNEKFGMADTFLEKAIEKGYVGYDVYVNLGLTKESNGKLKQAEISFEKALSASTDNQEKWMTYNNLCLFYWRNNMLLKAERTADKAIVLLPAEYQSYHLKFVVLSARKKYGEIDEMFVRISPEFKDDPQYLVDMLAHYEQQGKFSAELKLLEENEKFMELLPEETLKKRIKLYFQRENRTQAVRLIYELFQDYGDLEAGYMAMVYEVMNEDYIKAGNIGQIIMSRTAETTVEPDAVFYHTMYLEAIILDKLFQSNPPKEIRKQILSMVDAYAAWMKENHLTTEEMDKKIAMVRKMLEGTGA